MNGRNAREGIEHENVDRSEIIVAALRAYAPLKCEVVGASVLRGIATGATFGSVEGGRRHDLTVAIGLLSGVATLIDLSIKLILAYRARHDKLDDLPLSIIREELSKSEIVHELIRRDPNVVENILKILMEMASERKF